MQAVVGSGTKVDDKDIVYVTEMLMRQLLKLDGIEAEGEGKVQRKMEVSILFLSVAFPLGLYSSKIKDADYCLISPCSHVSSVFLYPCFWH